MGDASSPQETLQETPQETSLQAIPLARSSGLALLLNTPKGKVSTNNKPDDPVKRLPQSITSLQQFNSIHLNHPPTQFPQPNITNPPIPTGRGVFASQDIPARTVLEVCPVLVLDPSENENYVRKTELYHYTYNWPYKPKIINEDTNGASEQPTTTQAIILGLGSMFNHSTLHQNVGWARDVEHLLMTYTALRDIKEGEELCISYGSRLTFKDTEADALNEIEDEKDILSRIELID